MKKFLVLFVVSAIIFVGCKKKEEPSKEPPKRVTKTKTTTPIKGQDPVCGMQGEFKLTASYEGKDYGFCSENCKTKFDKSPTRYKWGFCNCLEKMPGCGCKHCKENSQPCECGKEEHPDEHPHEDEHPH